KSEKLGRVPTEMELILEYTQQGISYEARSILTDLQVTPTKLRRMTKPYPSHCFIANCFNAGNIKMGVKVPGSSRLTLISQDDEMRLYLVDDLKESFHEEQVLNCFIQKPLMLAHQNRHE
nr:hypothetical protein [Tanacetum cinerariifolium]